MSTAIWRRKPILYRGMGVLGAMAPFKVGILNCRVSITTLCHPEPVPHAGVIDKLDYIEGMGFDCIWITPVVKSLDYTGYFAEDTECEMIFNTCHTKCGMSIMSSKTLVWSTFSSVSLFGGDHSLVGLLCCRSTLGHQRDVERFVCKAS